MKHFEPLMTKESPLRTARVRMLETSDPASGSVSAKEESLYSSVIIDRYSRLISSDPARRIGVAGSPFAPSEVWMPEQPQASSSCTTTPSNEDSATPPYS